MNKEERLRRLIVAMTAYDHGDPMRIQHFMKVHNYAATIGTLEGLDADTEDILETAAVVHDIGIHVSEAKYGSSDGKHQEQEGPAEARRLLATLGDYSPEEVERVCFLIAHHHTYSNIQGQDYQILVEADFLVNLYEDHAAPESAGRVDPKAAQAAATVADRIFRTTTGKALLQSMFLTPRE